MTTEKREAALLKETACKNTVGPPIWHPKFYPGMELATRSFITGLQCSLELPLEWHFNVEFLAFIKGQKQPEEIC
jgi:hypothetical protein